VKTLKIKRVTNNMLM